LFTIGIISRSCPILRTVRCLLRPDQVDPDRRHAELEHPLRIHDVVDGIAKINATKELTQGFQQSARIVRTRLDEHVEILGCPRARVKSHGMCADDQVADATSVQCADELFEVAGHCPTLGP
jgi:hypothetical protein